MTLEQFSSALYQYPDDQECLQLFVRACRAAVNAREFPTPIDLRELLALPQVCAATRLWRASDGALAAYALVDPYHNLVFDIDPHVKSSALEDEIATWGIKHQHAAAAGCVSAPTLDSSCRADDRRRIAILQRHGFTRQEVESIHLERDLSLPIPSHPLPAGFVIRQSMGESEVVDWVALHRAAFDSDLMTAAMRRAMLDEPLYQPDLDLVFVAPGGRLAGYCCCGFSDDHADPRQPRRGYTDPVAVHPDFQRLGLSKALLARGLDLLRARGVSVVEIGTSSDNPAMLAAAKALGFVITSSSIWFSKTITPDSGV